MRYLKLFESFTDTNKVYHHIFTPNKFSNSANRFNSEVSNRLSDLLDYKPKLSHRFN